MISAAAGSLSNIDSATGLISHWLSNWDDLIAGAMSMSIFGYALRTIPPVENKWAQWLFNILNFIASNADRFKSKDLPATSNRTIPERPGTGPGTGVV